MRCRLTFAMGPSTAGQAVCKREGASASLAKIPLLASLLAYGVANRESQIQTIWGALEFKRAFAVIDEGFLSLVDE